MRLQETAEADRAIGARIRVYRRSAKVSQTELGQHLGVTFQQVQKYENGKNRISAGKVASIAKLLKVSPQQILGTEVKTDGAVVDPLAVHDRALAEIVLMASRLLPHRRRQVCEIMRTIIAAMEK